MLISVVVLTMGDRPGPLARAVSSARAQRDVDVEVVLVANGASDVGPLDPPAEHLVAEPVNVGIPEGRNRGAAVASGELLCFLDDDGELVGDHVLASVAERFAVDPRLGVVGLGVIDHEGSVARRHRPGLGRTTAGPATSFPGGACVIRRSAFEQVGGLCGPFFYALEETDLAWRLLDAGWDIRYEPDLRMRHPRTSPTRHPSFVERTARNRVWMAHRLLPLPLAVAYVSDWTLVTLWRARGDRETRRAHFAGSREGWRRRPGPRRPIAWSTVLRLTRAGRPPII